MLSIHNNLSAGTQNVTGNYACLQAHVNNVLTWQSSCVIANNNTRKTAKSYLSTGYNLDVHDVIKYMQKHCHMLLIISRASQVLCDVISRIRNRLSSLLVRFTPC